MFYNALEEKLPYSSLALLILAVFYGIYFTKMLIQKHRGIQTHQIGKRKEKALHRTETLMAIATFGIVPVQFVSILLDWTHLSANTRFSGFLMGVTGDLIFLAAVISMKDSWRAGIPLQDRTEIVTTGIYAFSRNPAFLGFDLMYLGICLMYCNLFTCLFTAFAVIMLHLQILQEESYLSKTFGNPYLLYKKQVFRYLGRNC